jgi:nitric oxide reductase NorD protein
LLNTEHEKYYYSFPTPELARDLFILIENARIEHQLSNVYKGLREDFKLVKSYLWYNRPEITPPGDDPKAQFLAAIECLIQYSLGRRWKGNIDDNRLLGNINRIISEFELIYSEENTVQDTALICFNIYNIFYDNFQIVTYFTKNDLKETFSSIFQPEIYSEVVLDTSPELLKEEELKGEQSEEDEEASVEDEDMAIDFASMRNISREDEYIKKLFAQGKMKIFRYPEFNHLKNSYEDNHCTLFERKLDSEESDYYEFILKKYKYEYKKIKKRFLMMTPDEVEMSRHWLSGEEIHMTDAFDYVMDLLRGESPDEKIYFRKIRNIRDIVVAILIDASSSTLESIDNQRIIDIEKSALTLLSSALDIIGDAFGIFSFFSMGRHRVFINVVKDFDEPWERSIRGRIPSIEGIASNRDGCAIRHIVHRLLGQPHKTKLLILLSDGIPADSNYGSTSSSETNEYAIEDTRRAIIEAKKQGVIPYCITIDRFAKSYIPHLYGDYRYAIINDVTMLPEKLSQLYLKLTR